VGEARRKKLQMKALKRELAQNQRELTELDRSTAEMQRDIEEKRAELDRVSTPEMQAWLADLADEVGPALFPPEDENVARFRRTG